MKSPQRDNAWRIPETGSAYTRSSHAHAQGGPDLTCITRPVLGLVLLMRSTCHAMSGQGLANWDRLSASS